MSQLPEMRFFEELLDTPRNNLVEKAIAAGRVPLGYNCYLVPEPLLAMGPCVPVRLRAPEVNSTELADYYLSNVVCSYARTILETALDGGCTQLNR